MPILGRRAAVGADAGRGRREDAAGVGVRGAQPAHGAPAGERAQDERDVVRERGDGVRHDEPDDAVELQDPGRGAGVRAAGHGAVRGARAAGGRGRVADARVGDGVQRHPGPPRDLRARHAGAAHRHGGRGEDGRGAEAERHQAADRAGDDAAHE